MLKSLLLLLCMSCYQQIELVLSKRIMSPIVPTNLGPVRGRLVDLWPHSPQVYEFIGIPFAEPPVGPRRFKKPAPKTPWNETLEAVKFPDRCMQSLTLFATANTSDTLNFPSEKNVAMSEDCLYLNLWVPAMAIYNKKMQKRSLAVMVFIHGGSFLVGNTMQDLYNGSILASYNNIIVATIQYRLGSLGFAYFGNEEAPGNMGLWDQLAALKWVNENIESFGGNSSHVTIFGQSAGAVSVAFHLISPHSRPYFSRAIMQSGSALAPWAYRTAEDATYLADALYQNIASNHLCADQEKSWEGGFATVPDMINCLRTADAAAFPETDTYFAFTGSGLAFLPIIDGEFIPKDPLMMLQTGNFAQVPIMAGMNKDEGSRFLMLSPQAMEILPNFRFPQKTVTNLNMTHYRKLLETGSFSLFSDAPQLKNPILMKAIELQYWRAGGKRGESYPHGLDVIKAAVDAGGDYAITCPVLHWLQRTANHLNKGSKDHLPIYGYYFTHRRRGATSPAWMGAMTGDELNYVFGEPLAPHAQQTMNYNSDDRSLSKIMMSFWSNFAKFGDPNMYDSITNHIKRKWPRFSDVNCDGLLLEISVLTQVFIYGHGTYCGFKSRECSFWEELFPQLVSNLPNPLIVAVEAY